MKRIAIAACFACAGWSAQLALAVTYNVPADSIPASLVAGDVLNYDPGPFANDLLPNAPAGAVVNVYSGAADFPFDSTFQGELNIFGGFVPAVNAVNAEITIAADRGMHYAAITQSHLQLLDGQLDLMFGHDNVVDIRGGRFVMEYTSGIEGTIINLSGGEIHFSGVPQRGLTLNMTGGELGSVEFAEGSMLNIRGGTTTPSGPSNYGTFIAHPGSNVHLYVREANLGGAAVPGLSPGATVVLDVTNTTTELLGTLVDGSPFAIDLKEQVDYDPVDRNAQIITNPLNLPLGASTPVNRIEVAITLVPEPPASILAAVGCVFALRRIARRQPEGFL